MRPYVCANPPCACASCANRKIFFSIAFGIQNLRSSVMFVLEVNKLLLQNELDCQPGFALENLYVREENTLSLACVFRIAAKFEQWCRGMRCHVMGIVAECCRSHLGRGKILRDNIIGRHCNSGLTECLVKVVSSEVHFANFPVIAETCPRQR